MKKIKKMIPGGKLRFVLIIELLILVVMAGSSLGKAEVIDLELSPENIRNDQLAGMDGDGNLILIKNEEFTEDTVVYETEDLCLPSGGYEIILHYDTAEGEAADVSPGQRVNCAHAEGASSAYPMKTESSRTYLSYGQTEAVGRIWINSVGGVDDFQLKIVSQNRTGLVIGSIAIVERRIWRLSRILQYLFVISILNLVLFYLLDERRDLRRRYTVLGILLLTGFASLPCFADFLYAGQDMEYHLSRICAVAEELQNGQIPVRIQSSMLQDYGYVSSLFYGDIFLYMPAFLYLMMFPLYTCYQIYLVAINLITVLCAYFSFKGIFKSQKTALLGSALYSLSAYRIVCVYTRAAVGEYTALAFLPLIIWGFWNLLTVKRKVTLREYWPLVIGMTGIIQSHILTCEEVALIGIFFFVCNLKAFFRRNAISGLIRAALVSVCMNAFFLIPFVTSYQMDLQIKIEKVDAIRSQGIYPVQLASLFLGSSGVSKTGTYEEMPLSLGLALVLGALLFLICLMNRAGWGAECKREFRLGNRALCCGIVALFFSSTLFWWEEIAAYSEAAAQLLCKIQFPWRYLSLAAALFVVVALCAVTILGRNKGMGVWYAAAGSLVLLTVLSVSYFYYGFTDSARNWYCYASVDIGTMKIGSGEYLLRDSDLDSLHDDEPYAYGDIRILHYEKDGTSRILTCENENSAGYVVIPVFCYDNYKAFDRETGEEFLIFEGENHAIMFELPASYQGTIEIAYREPALWRAAEFISLLTLLAVILYLRYPEKMSRLFGRRR